MACNVINLLAARTAYLFSNTAASIKRTRVLWPWGAAVADVTTLL
jgi:hypothetical protein